MVFTYNELTPRAGLPAHPPRKPGAALRFLGSALSSAPPAGRLPWAGPQPITPSHSSFTPDRPSAAVAKR